MLNLLRMDLYRIFRSKSLYICIGALVLANVLTFGLLLILSDPSTIDMLVKIGAEIKGDTAAMQTTLSGLSILELYRQATVGGGFFAVVTGILAALFVCMDFDSGFIKNIMAVHENKWDYILSKSVCFCIINFLYLAVTFVITWLLNLIAGGFFSYSSAGDILFYLFAAWMLINGFSGLILLICIVTRSKAAGVAGAICLSSGLIVTIISTVLSLFGLQWIMDNTLYMNLATLSSSFDGTYSLRPVITGVVFFVIYIVISKIVLSKKDI